MLTISKQSMALSLPVGAVAIGKMPSTEQGL